MKTLSMFLIALLLDACSEPQFYRKTELRSQHYTQMPDAQWCARMKAENWTPPECPRG